MKPGILRLILLLLLIPFFSEAQSIDFEKVKYSYTRPPQTPFPKGTRTYSVVVNTGNVNFTGRGHNYNMGYNVEQAINQYLLVNGYQRVMSGGMEVPDVTMEYFFSGVAMERQTVNSKTRTRNGQSVTTYHMDLVYYFPLTLIIKDKTGLVIQTIPLIPSNSEFSFRYPENPLNDFNDKYQIQSSYNNSSFQNFVNNRLRDRSLTLAALYINHHFAYTDVSEWINLPYVESKKYNYPQLDSCHLKLSKAIQMLSNKGSMDEIKVLLNGSLAHSLALGSEYDPNKKDQRVTKKVSGACDYNSAIAFMLLDQYDLALSSLNSSHEKMGHGHLAALKLMIEDKQKRYLANK